MSLFGQLHLGLTGLRAHQYALEVTGDNISNVSTPGFNRRRLTLSHGRPLQNYPVGQLGGGVDAGPVVAVRDRFLETRHRLESSVASGDEARHRMLAGVEAVFAEDGGFGFQKELSAFFGSFQELGSEPESTVLRDQVLARSERLIERMQGGYQRLDQIARETDQDVTRLVAQVNDRLSRIADLNERIVSIEAQMPANAERDERAELMVELSELIEVASYDNQDGSTTVTMRDGQTLVIGSEAQSLQAAAMGPAGRVAVLLGGSDVTPLIGSGEIGGLIQVRDQELPAHQRTLDTLALELSQQVNALHQAGYALDGATTGGDFFVPFTPPGPGDPTGATMALAIDPALVADSSLVAAAATPGAAGDGDQAQAIADLADSMVMSGGTETFSEFYTSFTFGLGVDVERAGSDAAASAAVADHVEQQKLAVSAVSLDEEAVALIQFQRGYEASARFIRVVDEMTQVMMTIGA